MGSHTGVPSLAAARKLDGEVDPLVAVRLGLDLASVLLGRQHLLEQRLQLHLAEHAARLDVGQHPLQVAHALRQRLHFAQALVHLLQPFGHLPEALAEPGFQRGLQLLVDRLAHLVELGGVGLLQDATAAPRAWRAPRRSGARSAPLRSCSWCVSVSDSDFCNNASCCEKASICVFCVRVASAPCLTTASWNVARCASSPAARHARTRRSRGAARARRSFTGGQQHSARSSLGLHGLRSNSTMTEDQRDQDRQAGDPQPGEQPWLHVYQPSTSGDSAA
jgi:hypothetical protein